MALNQSFAVEDGFLVRRVVPARGEAYQHLCPLGTYEAVAHAIDEMAGAPFTGEMLRDRIDAPWSQVFAAFAFLKDRGCVVHAHGRRHKAAPGNAGVHLDAMTEVHALREKGPADPAFGYE
ncbi:MAG TPA: hypothetical protein PLU35_05065 [Phycisphaerales bacterium]|nr:hypothetical protein [Phycisphaerales bacterium]